MSLSDSPSTPPVASLAPPAPMDGLAAPPGWGAGSPPLRWSPAGFWRRTGAALIDLVGVLFTALTVAGMLDSAIGVSRSRTHLSPRELVAAALTTALLSLAPLVYITVCWLRGATLGMRAAGCRLIDARTGSLPSSEQVLLRLVGSFYSALALGIGFLWVGVAPDRRGWHDHLSGTAVIHGHALTPTWVWSGVEWVWALPPGTSTAPAPADLRPPSEPRPARSAWTWTDVVPLLVLFLPAILLSQFLVVSALQVARIGRGHPGAVSLLLDIAAYGVNLGLIWLFLAVRRHVHLRDLGLRLPRWPWFLAVLPALWLAWTVEGVLGELGHAFLPSSPNNQCHTIQADYGSALLLGLLSVAVIAPFVEELLFRGVVFGWLRGRTPLPVAIAVSAALFSLAHLGWREWSLLLPIFGIGCVLAALRHYSRSLWPGILVHASSNTVATLVVVLGRGRC